MEARKGRDGKTGSMPGTTARPGEAGRRQEILGYLHSEVGNQASTAPWN